MAQHLEGMNVEDLERTGAIDTAAEIATHDEHSLTVREACRRYPAAIFWAIVMSFTIVMEGYDTILIGNLFAYPSFKNRYGTYYPDLKETVISSPWQIGLGNGATVGSVIVSLFADMSMRSPLCCLRLGEAGL